MGNRDLLCVSTCLCVPTFKWQLIDSDLNNGVHRYLKLNTIFIRYLYPLLAACSHVIGIRSVMVVSELSISVPLGLSSPTSTNERCHSHYWTTHCINTITLDESYLVSLEIEPRTLLVSEQCELLSLSLGQRRSNSNNVKKQINDIYKSTKKKKNWY